MVWFLFNILNSDIIFIIKHIMQDNQIKIITIDHNNNIIYFTTDNYSLHKSIINNFLSKIDIIPSEISKLFETIFPYWNKDNLVIIKEISNKLILKNNNYLISESHSDQIITSFLNKEINLQFHFEKKTLEDLSRILIKSFYNIDKVLKITKFSTFLEKLEHNNKQAFNGLQNKPKSTKKNNNFHNDINSLSNIFIFTKSIKLTIPLNDFELYFYLMPLLNIKWLFPNLIEIELDLIEPLTLNNEEFLPGKCMKSLKKRKEKFLLMIFYCYFSSLSENLRALNIKMYDCYLIEIDYILKAMKILTNEFHLLSFFSKNFNLNKLSLEFNSLDSLTFEKIICIIHRNNYLFDINLTFFPPEEYFNLYNLSKIATILNVDLHNLTLNINRGSLITGMDSIIDDGEFILNKIIDFFNKNMDRLLFVIRSRDEIINLSLNFNFPNLVSSNDKYINIFYKFFFNLFYILEDPNNTTETLKIKSSNIFFYPKRNHLIDHFLNNVNLSSNRSLKNLNLNLKFFSVLNMENLFPKNLEYLSIGNLCLETFSNFSNVFNFHLKNLKYLKISINNIYFDLSNHISSIYRFFSSAKPKELEVIYFKSTLAFSNDEIIKIIDLINYDGIKKYKFKISKRNFNDKSKLPNSYYTFYFKREIFSLLYVFSKKNHNLNKNIKIFDNLRNLFRRTGLKEIEIKFV